MLKICERPDANLNRIDKSSIAALKKTVATSRTNVVFERVKSPFKIQASQKTYLSTERGKLGRNGMVSSLAPLTTLKQHNVATSSPTRKFSGFVNIFKWSHCVGHKYSCRSVDVCWNHFLSSNLKKFPPNLGLCNSKITWPALEIPERGVLRARLQKDWVLSTLRHNLF